jgi:microcompartment protein CcmK/EutM
MEPFHKMKANYLEIKDEEEEDEDEDEETSRDNVGFDKYDIVIIGGGTAAFAVIKELKKANFQGEV